MQNSSFLFNYDSEDSSAHSLSSYQFNSRGQAKSENLVDDSLTGNSTENERDVPAETGIVDQQEKDKNAKIDDSTIEAETAEVLRTIVEASNAPTSMQEHQHNNSNRIDARTVWQNALSELALQMPIATYDTWMRDTSVLAYEDGEFIIGLPNAYARDWIMNRLQNKIKRILGKLINRSVSVTFRVVPAEVIDNQDAKPTPLYDPHLYDPHFYNATNATTSPTTDLHNNSIEIERSADGLDDRLDTHNLNSGSARNGVVQPNSSPLLSEQFVSNLDEQETNDSNAEPSEQYTNNSDSPNSISVVQNVPRSGGIDGSLRTGYTFDTFIVGSHNQLAHAAAASIADGPGQSFNPLFIYGGVGLGKTHLLHAVGNLAAARGSRVLYCTSEQFTNELITSIRGRGTEAFRGKYRQVDVLLIDDIQFIAGKESTQEEFFHTFNHLHTAGRQVVLSSDRTPKALGTLEERLRSRFEGGLLTDISQPDFETRVAILQSKANKSGIRVNSDVLMLIAERVDSNIRELEGALNRMVVQAKLFSNKLDLQLAESILRNLAPQRTPRSPGIVIGIVAEHFHLTTDDMTGRSRTKEIANARQIAMYLLREENAMSLPSIGDHLGGRDHSTVRHGVEKINTDLERDEQLRREIMALRDKIYSAPEA